MKTTPVRLSRINQMLLQNSWKLLIFSLHIHPPWPWYCPKSVPSLGPQPTPTCWGRCGRLVVGTSPLGPRHEAQELCFIGAFITSLPWLDKKEGFHLSSLCASWHTRRVPRVFQGAEGVSVPRSRWLCTEWPTSSALCHCSVNSWMRNLKVCCLRVVMPEKTKN